MREKLTSWFKIQWNQSCFRQTVGNLSENYKHLKKFNDDHPQIGGGIVISLISLLIIGMVFVWNLAPVEFGPGTSQMFEIRYGLSLREISRQLESRGLIRNKTIYEIYVRLNFKDRMAKAGRYQISSAMSVPQLVQKLRLGTPQSIRITIPEGLTVLETANLLAAKGLINRERFMELLGDLNFVNSNFQEISLSALPEGYLFPDTYDFNLTNSETEILGKMLRRFEEVYLDLVADRSGTRLQDIVTIASIVEKEAKHASDRPLIAAVFYNRLDRGYRLQSCATIQYALGKRKERLYYKDLQVQSPYNTYRNDGLPPGPIASPGLESLKAALNPPEVSYLYFVAKPDGSHIFSNTYEQHLRAQRLVARLERNQQ